MNPFNAIPVNPLTPSDEQFLCIENTDDARAELVMRAMREAEAYTRKVSKGQIPDDELFSICYEALTRAVKNFKPGRQRFFPYAKAYCRGCVWKAWRSRDVVKNSYEHREETPSDSPTVLVPDTVQFGFSGIHIKELWSQLEPVMDKCFSEQERAVLTMRYSSGYCFREIGKLLGVSGNAAEGAHSRALKKLRRALAKRGTLFK